MKYLLLIIIFLFPFGQLTRLPLPSFPAVNIYAHDLSIAALAITTLIYYLGNRKTIQLPPLAKPIGIFIGAALISIIFNITRYPLNEVITGSLYLLRWGAYATLYFSVYWLVVKGSISENGILAFLGCAGIFSAVFGLAQYFLYPNLRNLMYLGWDPHEYRIFGTYFDSGFAGLIFVLTLILTIHAYNICRHSEPNEEFISNWIIQQLRSFKMTDILAITVVFSTLALTYSRSSYLAFMAAGALHSLLNKSARSFIIAVALIVPLFFLLPKPTPTAEGADLTRITSAQARLTNYDQSMQIIQDHPITGIGFNMLRYENRNRGFVPDYEWEWHHAAAGLDNSFLFVLAATGIIGFAAYANLLLQSVYITMKQSTNKIMQHSAIISLGAVYIHSIFNNSLFYPWVLIWLWILLAVAHAPRRT